MILASRSQLLRADLAKYTPKRAMGNLCSGPQHQDESETKPLSSTENNNEVRSCSACKTESVLQIFL